MTSNRDNRGHGGERQAESWLCARGLEVVERNYRCRAGEIDLVMLDDAGEYGKVLVFVEVRLRAPGARVGGIESVDEYKQLRLIQTARHFLAAHEHFGEHLCRFDVLAIDGDDGRIEWIADAFQPKSD